MKLTIGMIVKNESKYLESCLRALDSIRKSVDSELIIVDTGSTDNTVEIAKSFTDKVFFHKWDNDFAKARNITIEKSKGEWYFYLDADEILENPESIIDFFKNGHYKEYEAMAIRIENLKNEDKSQIGSIFYSKRIVKKDKNLKFISKIHEYLPAKNPTYVSEKPVLIHYGYLITEKQFVEKKAKRNIDILKSELESDPENTFLLYHLANTLNFNFKYAEALEVGRKVLDITRKLKTEQIYIYILYLDLLIKNKLFFEVENVALEVIKLNFKENSAHINLYFFLAQAQGMINKYSESIENYKKCLELLNLYEEHKLDIDLQTVVADFGGEKYIYSQMSAEYDIISDYNNALYYTEKILNLTRGKKSSVDQDYLYKSINQIIKLSVKYEDYDYILKLYNNILNEEYEDKIDLEYRFIDTLEDAINTSEISKNEIVNRFANLDLDTDYVFINKLRIKKQIGEQLSIEDVNKIYEYDFNIKHSIYGELIFYIMEDGFRLNEIMNKLEESELNRYIEYINYKFYNLSQIIVEYFNKYEDAEDINSLIFSKALKRVVLIKGDVDNESYFSLFNRYVKEGICYMNQVYKDSVLDSENIYVVKNNEEAFYIYMRKALMYKLDDQVKYLQYLRKSIKTYDYMKKGIEILLEQFRQQDVEYDSNDEFDEYKDIIKKNIKSLLQNQKLDEAELLIDEYLKIVPNDLEIIALKPYNKLTQ